MINTWSCAFNTQLNLSLNLYFRFGQMNDLVIIQTTQGLAEYLLSEADLNTSVSIKILS